jgi:hypothetical protein
MPGDTATLEVSTKIENPGFVNDGYRREVLHNGTFTGGSIPSIGYDQNLEMESDEDRKKYGLPEKPDDLPPHRDPYGERTLLFSDDADFITFRMYREHRARPDRRSARLPATGMDGGQPPLLPLQTGQQNRLFFQRGVGPIRSASRQMDLARRQRGEH